MLAQLLQFPASACFRPPALPLAHDLVGRLRDLGNSLKPFNSLAPSAADADLLPMVGEGGVENEVEDSGEDGGRDV